MLAGGLIISRRFVQVRTTTKHRSTHISNCQSSEHKPNQHDDSYCYYHYLLVTNYLAIKLLATYSFSTCRHYLTENYLPFPSAPHWVRHSYLSKRATIDPLYLWVIK